MSTSHSKANPKRRGFTLMEAALVATNGLVGGAGADADLNNQPVTGQSLVAQAF